MIRSYFSTPSDFIYLLVCMETNSILTVAWYFIPLSKITHPRPNEVRIKECVCFVSRDCTHSILCTSGFMIIFLPHSSRWFVLYKSVFYVRARLGQSARRLCGDASFRLERPAGWTPENAERDTELSRLLRRSDQLRFTPTPKLPVHERPLRLHAETLRPPLCYDARNVAIPRIQLVRLVPRPPQWEKHRAAPLPAHRLLS